jgi:peroxiredoxin Q/BCP
MGKELGVGDRMPAFSLPDQGGQLVRSDQLLGRGPLVVYFYPRDDSPVCTAEACAFRDHHDVFREAGAQVIGISDDGTDRHARFAGRHGLPFALLSDHDSQVRRQFGVRRTLGLLPGRVTFVVDRDGIIRHKFSSQLMVSKHVTEALDIVKRLQ